MPIPQISGITGANPPNWGCPPIVDNLQHLDGIVHIFAFNQLTVIMETKKISKGAIISADLTVENAERIRDFYQAVIGWSVEEMPLKDGDEAYSDYVMKDADGNWVGGVCHHRGANKGIPPQWIVYITVQDIAASMQRCLDLGGTVVKESRNQAGECQYVIIRDPAGAVLGLTSVPS